MQVVGQAGEYKSEARAVKQKLGARVCKHNCGSGPVNTN